MIDKEIIKNKHPKKETKEKLARVVVKNISKKFVRKYKKTGKSTLSRIVSVLSKKDNRIEFVALNNVSFRVFSGENFGIIGKNGSGKSTLLRIISEIYSPDTGFVKTKGKLIYITGFGQGLKQKLTMKENIYLVGSIMGLNKKEIDKKLNQIVNFSGLKEYLDAQVYQFSSGMITRLGFSISIHCLKHHKPDILVIDEAFGGGGDITFQQKAVKKMEEIIKGGATIVMASHSLPLVEKLCDRVLLLDKGKVVKIGDPKQTVNFYKKNIKNNDAQKLKGPNKRNVKNGKGTKED